MPFELLAGADDDIVKCGPLREALSKLQAGISQDVTQQVEKAIGTLFEAHDNRLDALDRASWEQSERTDDLWTQFREFKEEVERWKLELEEKAKSQPSGHNDFDWPPPGAWGKPKPSSHSTTFDRVTDPRDVNITVPSTCTLEELTFWFSAWVEDLGIKPTDVKLTKHGTRARSFNVKCATLAVAKQLLDSRKDDEGQWMEYDLPPADGYYDSRKIIVGPDRNGRQRKLHYHTKLLRKCFEELHSNYIWRDDRDCGLIIMHEKQEVCFLSFGGQHDVPRVNENLNPDFRMDWVKLKALFYDKCGTKPPRYK